MRLNTPNAAVKTFRLLYNALIPIRDVAMDIAIRAAILVTLLVIVASLGSGLFYLMKDRGDSRRTLNALTLRIALSVILFLLILLGFLTGVITPNQSPLA